MNQLSGENKCDILPHSQQQSQAPETHKKDVEKLLLTIWLTSSL